MWVYFQCFYPTFCASRKTIGGNGVGWRGICFAAEHFFSDFNPHCWWCLFACSECVCAARPNGRSRERRAGMNASQLAWRSKSAHWLPESPTQNTIISRPANRKWKSGWQRRAPPHPSGPIKIRETLRSSFAGALHNNPPAAWQQTICVSSPTHRNNFAVIMKRKADKGPKFVGQWSNLPQRKQSKWNFVLIIAYLNGRSISNQERKQTQTLAHLRCDHQENEELSEQIIDILLFTINLKSFNQSQNWVFQ